MQPKKALKGASQGVEAITVEDVFLVNVRSGTGANVNVSAPDMTTDGGLCITKARTTTTGWRYVDTARGATLSLDSSTTGAEATEASGLTAFTSTGVTLGADSDYNASGQDFVDSFFKVAPRFFDMVKYTGNGVVDREIPHNLGCDVGMIIVKDITNTREWLVYHRTQANCGLLNLTNSFASAQQFSNLTDTSFDISDSAYVNGDGNEYIAYLFAHDPLGASGDGSDGMIACGFIANGTSFEVDLGWEPQYLLVKKTNGVDDWLIFDNIRGVGADGVTTYNLDANNSTAEGSGKNIHFSATGFYGGLDTSSENIYMAIRRPMKSPTSSDEVFAIDTRGSSGGTPNFKSGFTTDMSIWKATGGAPNQLQSRLTGHHYLQPSSTAAETTNDPNILWDYMDGFYNGTSVSATQYSWMFKRATGFFDVVTHTDLSSSDVIKHNLGVIPELIWEKCRSTTEDWYMYHKDLTSGYTLKLNTDAAEVSDASRFTALSDTQFTYGGGTATRTRIFYLFASLTGISNVFSFTADGTKTIDCGFSTGAKMVMLKRKDGVGGHYLWDSVRGIIAGDDPYLLLNSTSAEVTNTDLIDPDSSGFISNINDGGVYVGYSIANPL